MNFIGMNYWKKSSESHILYHRFSIIILFFLLFLLQVTNAKAAAIVCDCPCGETGLSYEGEDCATYCDSICDSNPSYICDCCCENNQGKAGNWNQEPCETFCPTVCSHYGGGNGDCSQPQVPGFPTDPDNPELHEEFHTNGQVRLRYYYYYKKDGESDVFTIVNSWVSWHENGQKSTEVSYADGKMDGAYQEWYEDGTLRAYGSYVSGDRQGTWTSWHENGEKSEEGSYNAGQRQGTWSTWHEDGALFSQGDYFNGAKAGLWTYTWDSFRLEGNYENNLRAYTWTLYDALDRIVEQYEYIDGLKRTLIYYHDDLINIKTRIELGEDETTPDSAWTNWHTNGVVCDQYTYVKGKIQFEAKTWYRSGNPRQIINFKDSLIHGSFKEWYDDGHKKFEGSFLEGKKSGEYKKWVKGEYGYKLETYTYVNDEKNGPGIGYYDSVGFKKKWQVSYVDDKREGVGYWWCMNGQKDYEVNYENGKLHGLYISLSCINDTSKTVGYFENGTACGTWTHYSVNHLGEEIVTKEYYPVCKGFVATDNITDKDGVIRGRVVDPHVNKNIENCSVFINDNLLFTDKNGKFSTIIKDIPETVKVIADKEGYITAEETLQTSGKRYHFVNITLSKKTGKPTIRKVDTGGTCYLHNHTGAMNKIKAWVDWDNEDYRDKVVFDVNGTTFEVPRWSDGSYSKVFDMGIDPFIPSVSESGNYVTVTATDKNGMKSAPYTIHPVVLPVPDWAENLYSKKYPRFKIEGKEEYLSYHQEAKFPNEPLDFMLNEKYLGSFLWGLWNQVPLIGGREFGILPTQVWARSDIYALKGAGNLTLGGKTGRAMGVNLELVGIQLAGAGEIEGAGLLYYDPGVGLLPKGVEMRIFMDGTVSAEIGLNDLIPSINNLGTTGKIIEMALRMNPLLGSGNAKASVNLKGDNRATLYINEKDELDFKNAELLYRLSIMPSMAFKMGNMNVSVEGTGVGNLRFQVPAKPTYLNDMEASIDLAAKFQTLGVLEHHKCEFHFTKANGFQHKCEKVEQKKAERRSKSDSENGGSERYLIPRDFLDAPAYNRFTAGNPNKKRGEASGETKLVENIYPYAEAVMDEKDGKRIVVYTYYNGSLPGVQATDIYYLYHNGASWSAPSPILADTRADYNPDVSFDTNGNPLAVWTRVKNPGLTSTDLEDTVADLEIVYSLYSPATDTWSAPAHLTDNSHMDHNPKLARGDTGNILLTWMSNTGNIFMGDSDNPDMIWHAFWNGSSFTAPARISSSFSYARDFSADYNGTEATLTYTQDMDQDPATLNDTEIHYITFSGSAWGPKIRLTNDNLMDISPKALYLSGSGVELFFRKGDNLVRITDWGTGAVETVRPQSTSAAFFDYKIIRDHLNRLMLSWQGVDGHSPDLFYTLFDPESGLWSEDLRLTQDQPIEISSSGVFSADRTLHMVYSKQDLQANLDDPTPINDLYILEKSLASNLCITNDSLTAEYQVENPGPGDTAQIKCKVKNTGNFPLLNIPVHFYLNDPDDGGSYIGSASLAGFLKAGAEAEAVFNWTVTSLVNTPIFAVVDPLNTVVESDESDNKASFHPVKWNVSLALRAGEYRFGEWTEIVAELINNGSGTVEGLHAAMTIRGRSPETQDVPPLLPGETAQIPWIVRMDEISSGNGDNIIDVELLPETRMSELSNLKTSIIFNRPSQEMTDLEQMTAIMQIITERSGEYIPYLTDPDGNNRFELRDALYYLRKAAGF